jgi:hypothetical protein
MKHSDELRSSEMPMALSTPTRPTPFMIFLNSGSNTRLRKLPSVFSALRISFRLLVRGSRRVFIQAQYAERRASTSFDETLPLLSSA